MGGDRRGQAEMLCKAAEVAVANKDHGLGLSPLKEAQSIYQSLGDDKGEARAMLAIAQIRVEQGEAGDAVKMAEAATATFRGLGKSGMDGYIASLDCVVKATAALGSIDEAFAFAVDKLKTFNKDREKKGEAVMLMAIANIQL